MTSFVISVMKKFVGTALILVSLSLASCSGSNEQVRPEPGASVDEVDAPGSQGSEAPMSGDESESDSPGESATPGTPMSVFDDAEPVLPMAIGEIGHNNIRFPCRDFTLDKVSFVRLTGAAYAECPSRDERVVFTSLTGNFAYTLLPTFTFDDFPLNKFAVADAVHIHHDWRVGPDGTIAYLITMAGPDKVTPGVDGTTNDIYFGLATLAQGESSWTFSTVLETTSADLPSVINSVRLRDITHSRVTLIGIFTDGLSVVRGVARDGSTRWELSDPEERRQLLSNTDTLAELGPSGTGKTWIDGFVNPTDGTFESINPSYSSFDGLIAFDSYWLLNGPIPYDNPGIFGVDFDSGYVRLPESSRFTGGKDGTWTTHVECDVNNSPVGEIDDCTQGNRKYITPSGKTFEWDRRLLAVVGDNAVFAEQPYGYYVIGPDGEEIARNDGTSLVDYDIALTMNDQYLLFYDNESPINDWLILRIA
jgi:hypothetical protein